MDELMEVWQDEEIERIVESYSNRLIRIAMHHVGSMSEAEDIAQSVFVKLIEAQPRFESEEHEKAWLIRVAINLCKDHYKKAWTKRVVLFNKMPQVSYEASEEGVLEELRQLPHKYRDIMYLFYYEEFSVHEMAKLMGIKEGTVLSRLHRGRNLLKGLLKGDADHE